jgi:hypothetical protein
MFNRILKAVTKRPPHIEVRAGLVAFHVTLVGANGQPIMHSEDYSCESNAYRAARNLAAITGWKVK